MLDVWDHVTRCEWMEWVGHGFPAFLRRRLKLFALLAPLVATPSLAVTVPVALQFSSSAEIESRRVVLVDDHKRLQHDAQVSGNWATGGLITSSVGSAVILLAALNGLSHDDISEGDLTAMNAGAGLVAGGAVLAIGGFTFYLGYASAGASAEGKLKALNRDEEAYWASQEAVHPTLGQPGVSTSVVSEATARRRQATWRRYTDEMDTQDTVQYTCLGLAGASLIAAYYGLLYSTDYTLSDSQERAGRNFMWGSLATSGICLLFAYRASLKHDALRSERAASALTLAPAAWPGSQGVGLVATIRLP